MQNDRRVPNQKIEPKKWKKKACPKRVSTLNHWFKKLDMKQPVTNWSWRDRGSLFLIKRGKQQQQLERPKLVHIYSIKGGTRDWKLSKICTPQYRAPFGGSLQGALPGKLLRRVKDSKKTNVTWIRTWDET